MTTHGEASSWLFARGSESVRLVREETSHGCHLFLYGPSTDVVTHDFADLIECMKRQAEIEQALLAAGYQLTGPSSERRHEAGIWGGPDHRRSAT